MKNHRYVLEPYGSSTKKTCPKCKKDRAFTLYIDTETNEHVHPEVGICDHKLSCGYHLPPRQYFQDNNISIDTIHCSQLKRELIPQKPASYIPTEVMEASLRGYKQNNLVTFLGGYFSDTLIADMLQKYFVGTSKHWTGSTVFWLVDTEGKIRSGKICQYNPETGKRIKEPYPLITWVHRVLRLSEFQLKKCLFGEHLLKDETKTIALVESEKTALICSMCLPEHIWLATGGLTNLTAERCSVLKGRTVILFPDLKGYDLWNEKAKEFSILMPGACLKVSDLLERNASDEDRDEGLDIADYLIKHRKPIAEAETTLGLLVEKNPILSNLIDAFKLIQEVPKTGNNPS
jgi:hypothetical protein